MEGYALLQLVQLWSLLTKMIQTKRRRAARAELKDGEEADEGIHDSTAPNTDSWTRLHQDVYLSRKPC